MPLSKGIYSSAPSSYHSDHVPAGKQKNVKGYQDKARQQSAMAVEPQRGTVLTMADITLTLQTRYMLHPSCTLTVPFLQAATSFLHTHCPLFAGGHMWAFVSAVPGKSCLRKFYSFFTLPHWEQPAACAITG